MFGRNKENKENNEKQRDLTSFVYFDSVSESYGMPVFAINEADLVRQLITLFNAQYTPQHPAPQIVTNPEDYTIFENGYYDRKAGELEATKAHRKVITMLEVRNLARAELVRKKQEQDQFEGLVSAKKDS